MDAAPTEDRVRELIAIRAQACLDHVRVVTWGEGLTAYEMPDNGVRILVEIRVKSLGPVKDS